MFKWTNNITKQEQQCVAVVDPGMHMAFLFARCLPTRTRFAVAAAQCCCSNYYYWIRTHLDNQTRCNCW